MHVLIIGGTHFLGRHLVIALVQSGHQVTLFHRGQTNPDLFTGPDYRNRVKHVFGDRKHTDDFAKLRGRTFDVVIDTCGHMPADVTNAANTLRASAESYVFISSVNVYDFTHEYVDETTPVLLLPPDADSEIFDIQYYGEFKALCEHAAQTAFGEDRTLIIRPGLIVGPHDPTDRFTYWPYRFSRGGTIVAPVGPEIETDFIDVRDLAEWIVRVSQRNLSGVFNATSPPHTLTLGSLFEICQAVTQTASIIAWCTEESLIAHGVEPWSDLPLWTGSNPKMPGFLNVHVTKALQAGLRFRPLSEIVRDTLTWIQNEPTDRRWHAGLTEERERELLER